MKKQILKTVENNFNFNRDQLQTKINDIMDNWGYIEIIEIKFSGKINK